MDSSEYQIPEARRKSMGPMIEPKNLRACQNYKFLVVIPKRRNLIVVCHVSQTLLIVYFKLQNRIHIIKRVKGKSLKGKTI